MPSAVTFARGRSGTAEGGERITLTVLAPCNAGGTLPLLPPFRLSAFDRLATAYILSIAILAEQQAQERKELSSATG